MECRILFCKILLYGILKVLIKAVPQIFRHQFSLLIDRNAGSFIPVFLMLQQEELLAVDLRFVNRIPCANMTLDRNVIGIAVKQSIVFLFLLFHKLPDGQQSTREVQTFFAQFQPTICTKVKFFCHQDGCRMVYNYRFLHQNRLSRIIVRPTQIIAVQPLRHIFIPQSAVAEKTGLIKDFNFLQLFIQNRFFLQIHLSFLEKIRQLCKADAVHIAGFDRLAIVQHHNITDGKRMPGKIRWTLDIEAFVNGFQRIFFRKRLGIDQLIVCTVHFHPMPFYKVQIHKAVVMFRVTGSDLVDAKLLFIAGKQFLLFDQRIQPGYQLYCLFCGLSL